MKAYRYVQSGLDNVLLLNGFRYEDTPYGRGVAIDNVEGLHRTIAQAVTEKPGELIGPEFRFLRVQLELSKKRLSELLGLTTQDIEKCENNGQISKTIDFLIRHIYRQTIEDRKGYVDMVDHLRSLDHKELLKLNLEETAGGWGLAQTA